MWFPIQMNKKQAHLLNVPAISDQEHKGDDGSANPFQKQGEERGGGGCLSAWVSTGIRKDTSYSIKIWIKPFRYLLIFHSGGCDPLQPSPWVRPGLLTSIWAATKQYRDGIPTPPPNTHKHLVLIIAQSQNLLDRRHFVVACDTCFVN